MKWLWDWPTGPYPSEVCILKQTLQIAIDGPAGAGKSSVAKVLAKRLNCIYLDTGRHVSGRYLACHAAGHCL